MTSFDIYLMILCGKVNEIAGIASVVSIMLGVATFVMTSMLADIGSTSDKNRIWKKGKMVMWTLAVIFTISVPVYVVTPTRNEIIAIYAIPRIANSEHAQEASKYFLKLLEEEKE